eukprot:m.189571 g.189571  ORF g.189571 m.189571 type:complete len:649 (+) comp15111_c0_seq4:125-2071(+)
MNTSATLIIAIRPISGTMLHNNGARWALTVLCGALTVSDVAADPSDLTMPAIPLWPWPQSVDSGDGISTVSSKSFQWRIQAPPGYNATTLSAAVTRYENYAFGAVTTVSGGRDACPRTQTPADGKGVATEIVGLTVLLSDDAVDAPLRMHGDESYELQVPVSGWARLQTHGTPGALRGLETFHQLLQFARTGTAPTASFCDYVVMKTPLSITDAPRYTHRGLLVDTGRDYHSVDGLKKTIESLAWNKLSVFHWHIVEIDSFPLELDSFPQLAKNAAFATNQVYTKAQVAEIVDYGRAMGVRVVPEIEMPGHMSAYGLGLPELNLTIDTGNHHGVAAYGVANLASSHLIPTLSTILREAASMFDDELFFLGGDETDCPYNECDYVYYKNQTERCPHMATERTNWTCPPSGWMLNPEVSAWAKSQSVPGNPTGNLADHAELFTYFADQVEPVLVAAGKRPAWWNDRYDTLTTKPNSAPLPSTKPIIENWLRSGPDGLTPYLQDGFQVWQGSGWYLGQDLNGFRSPKTYPPSSKGSYQSTGYCVQGPSDWAPFYLQDPEHNASGATAEQMAELILGGEASAWGDCISAESFDNFVWPTTSAVAERLWSPKALNNVSEALPRLAAMRCSMVRRGVRASPLHPGSCWSSREID